MSSQRTVDNGTAAGEENQWAARWANQEGFSNCWRREPWMLLWTTDYSVFPISLFSKWEFLLHVDFSLWRLHTGCEMKKIPRHWTVRNHPRCDRQDCASPRDPWLWADKVTEWGPLNVSLGREGGSVGKKVITDTEWPKGRQTMIDFVNCSLEHFPLLPQT